MEDTLAGLCPDMLVVDHQSTMMRTYFCLEAVDAWSDLLALCIIHRLP